jgi:hypothetical protein
VADDAQLLAAEVNGGYRDLADRIRDEALLVTPIALRTPGWNDADSGVCWLAPLSPALERMGILQAMVSRSDECTSLLSFAKLDSLRPRLRWMAFPRDVDRKDLDPRLLRGIRDVTYDLKIWEVERCERGNLVYERGRLANPEHEVEEALKPGQRYYWSFRARFSADDQPMTTPWSRFDPSGCDSSEIDEAKYHRFVTPK